MKVLLTGNEGLIGRAVERRLQADGDKVAGYDLANSNDIRKASAVIEAGTGCDAAVHLAALLGNDERETAEEILRTNLLGTLNFLESARINGFRKVVYMSSVDALGLFKGEGIPDYFPIDDDHPCRPTTPYGISKKLAEEACCSFSQRSGIPTVCLRPPGVWSEQTYSDIVEARRKRPEYEWDPYWEYGAFIDVRDLADLVVRCLRIDFAGYDCYLATSEDITTSGSTSLEIARSIHPSVRWKNQDGFESDPYRTLLDCRRVQAAFRWKPRYSWRGFIKQTRTGTPG